MSRVERKNIEKMNKEKKGKKISCIIFLFFILSSGILIVDDSFRDRMMIEETKVFGYEKINESLHQICFCGDNYYIDEQKIYDTYSDIKNEVEILMQILKDKKKNFLKE